MSAHARQLELYEPPSVTRRVERPGFRRAVRLVRPLCAVCHAKPARYGFRDEEGLSPASTLCFDCFHTEIMRRQELAARLARMRAAEQAELPLDEAGRAAVRRRRAPSAARRARGMR